MSKQKTLPTSVDPVDFIHDFVDQASKISDALALKSFMETVTGEKAIMWGPSIIGFGSYDIVDSKGKTSGTWPKVGFSPRKAAISLYVFAGHPEQVALLPLLGKYTMGKGCIYVKKLDDINLDTLKQLIVFSMQKPIRDSKG